MTKRGKRRFVIFLCAAAVILVAAGIVRVKLHPPRPLHEQIADYMYHSRTDPKLEYLVEKYGDEFVATEYGSIQSTRFSDFYVNVEWYEEEKTYKDDYIVYLRKQELESILIPIAEPIFGKCKLFVISYGDCPSNYGKDTSALELLGASEEYPLVQVCVYHVKKISFHKFFVFIQQKTPIKGTRICRNGQRRFKSAGILSVQISIIFPAKLTTK
ncbi:MAG TPA: hypothetical protein PLD42_07250 [Gemmiger formicilis]|nr:hypothetical protein [Gemmiger formicilis]